MLIIRLAWRNIWRHTRRTLITATAMAGGLALCMAYLCLMEGMFNYMFDVAVGKQIGHAQIHAEDFPKRRALYDVIPNGAALEKSIRERPEVADTVGRVFGYALVGAGDEAVGVQLQGVDPGAEDRFRGLAGMIESGKWLSDRPEQGIVLGYQAALDLKAKLGDEIVAVTTAADGSMGNELYKLIGIIKTNTSAIDKSGAFLHRQDVQELLALEESLHEIAILSTNRDDIAQMVDAVKEVAPKTGLLVRSWGEINPTLFQMLGMRDALMFFISFLVFGVAGLGILNTMLMSVFERTRELGVLIALGLKPMQILKLILMETIFLSAIAVTLGLILGAGLDWYIVTQGISFGTSIEMMGMRLEPVIYGEVQLKGIIVTSCLVFVIAILASLWPAIRAARLQPVVAMRDQ